ncbi:uncharacterized protein LOC112904327 [Agrilus planipennis]|uniref:Uncharacterized protein LOC112904327 n=1 Tax=Agrilus planipennis TaxID=224129 RepID=A0A7F5QXF2_AGRPL|nr:uncharacterized protein LOC112904327 [Agrilus planipennis]
MMRLMEADPEGIWMTSRQQSNELVTSEMNRNMGISRSSLEEQSRGTVSEEDATGRVQGETVPESEEGNRLIRRELELLRRERQFMEDKISLLERERELMQREYAIGNRYEQFEMPVAPKASLKAISESLKDYDGGVEFIEWEKQVRYLKRVFALDDDLLKLLISSKLKGKASTWFHSKSEHRELSSEELLKTMKEFFDHSPTKLQRKKEFENRKWQTSETFDDYYYDKTILANKVPVDDEEELIEYLIEGISERALRNQARMLRVKKKSELLLAFRGLNLYVEPKHKKDIPNRKFDRRVSENKSEEQKAMEAGTSKSDDKGQRHIIKCYICNRKGHMARDCRNGSRGKGACFNCNETGHLMRNCPLTKKEDKGTRVKEENQHQVSNVYEEPASHEECREIVTIEINDCSVKRILDLDTQLDTGSPISLIKERFVEKGSIKHSQSVIPNYTGINNSPINILGIVNARVTLYERVEENIPLYVVSEETIRVSSDLMRQDGVLGVGYDGALGHDGVLVKFLNP